MSDDTREVIEVFGSMAKGAFHTAVMTGLDMIVIDTFATAAESRVAAQMTAKPKRERDMYPNNREVCGHYGMYHTQAGHARAVRRCLRALRPIANTFDVLYVTGLSGSVPAAVVAYLMKKELVILRKEADRSHGTRVEGDAQAMVNMRYMIVDDFVSNGSTLRNLLKAMPKHAVLAGVMLYGHPRAKAEIESGKAKILHTYKPGHGREEVEARYHMVRRGSNSMLFDLIRQEPA